MSLTGFARFTRLEAWKGLGPQWFKHLKELLKWQALSGNYKCACDRAYLRIWAINGKTASRHKYLPILLKVHLLFRSVTVQKRAIVIYLRCRKRLLQTECEILPAMLFSLERCYVYGLGCQNNIHPWILLGCQLHYLLALLCCRQFYCLWGMISHPNLHRRTQHLQIALVSLVII